MSSLRHRLLAWFLAKPERQDAVVAGTLPVELVVQLLAALGCEGTRPELSRAVRERNGPSRFHLLMFMLRKTRLSLWALMLMADMLHLALQALRRRRPSSPKLIHSRVES